MFFGAVAPVRIATVLRSGGEYEKKHVVALQRQLLQFAPLYEFVCLSDVNIGGVQCLPLERSYPGWWSKMELFRPDIGGDILYMDLDTVVVGPLAGVLSVKELTMLRDFYRTGAGYPKILGSRKEGLGSGLMFLPEAQRGEVWADWVHKSAQYMVHYARGGDQLLLEKHYLQKARRWQDDLPGQIVSWKVHCKNGVPPNARVICFHGQPRPFAVPQFKDLYSW